MISRIFYVFFIIAAVVLPAAAQERVVVGTVRSADNGVLFLAHARDLFKAEGLDVDVKAYPTAQLAAAALAAGDVDLASTEFSLQAFNLAGKGTIKIVAAQAREKNGYEGNEIVASPAAYAAGLRKPENLANHSVAVTQLGSAAYYQLGAIAAAKHFDFKSLTLKPQRFPDAVARSVIGGQSDAAILPPVNARDLLTANEGKLVGWVSEIAEPQIGALFASAKMLSARRPAVEAFVRAYRHGAAEFADALLRKDRYGKRVSDAKSQAAAARIARYVFPDHAVERVTGAIEVSSYAIDPQAQIDVADIVRQIDWYKSQGLIDADSNAQLAIDDNLAK
jgi:NitT/TauT family transport system substrate-binding protein